MCSTQLHVSTRSPRTLKRRGHARGPLAAAELGTLTTERELEVLRVLSTFSDIVAIAARERAPHKITTWLRELAAAFHGFYADCYVVGDGVSPELTQARLWLIEAARIGLTGGLRSGWCVGTSGNVMALSIGNRARPPSSTPGQHRDFS